MCRPIKPYVRGLLGGVAALAYLQGAVAAAQSLEVRGRVFDYDAQPVAEARIELEPLLPTYQRVAREPTETAAATRSDRDGEFSLLAPQPGFWRLVVRHADFLPARFDLSPLLTARQLPDLQVPRRSEMAMRLLDAEGQPMPGVDVWARGWSSVWQEASREGWWPLDRRMTTNGEGMAALPCATFEQVTVTAMQGERYLYTPTTCEVGLLELRLDTPLQEVEVTDAEGRPVSGPQGFVSWPLLAIGNADDEGRLRGPFSWDGAVPTAFADAEGYYGKPDWRGVREIGDEFPVVALPPIREVSGRVVDSLDGQPVEGAWMWVGSGSHHFQAVPRDGSFSVKLPRDGKTSLRFAAPGYLTVTHALNGDAEQTLEARLTPGITMPLRVVDVEGAPIDGVSIRERRPLGISVGPRHRELLNGGHWILETAEAVTDGGGLAELRGLPPWVGFSLRVTRPGYAVHYESVLGLPPGEPVSERVITLTAGVSAWGRVVTESEMPITGAEVSLLPSLVGDASELNYEVKDNFAGVTDATGRFELADVPAGRYYLAAKARGFPELLVPGLDLEVSAEGTDLGTVVLAPGLLISGRVIDGNGDPLAGAQLSVRNADGEQIVVQRASSPWFATATSRENGSFHLEGLPRESRLALLVTADGYPPRELAVVLTDQDQRLEIELASGSSASGWVLGPDGQPVGRASVYFASATGKLSRTVTTTDDGRFEIFGLTPGDYDILARSSRAESDLARHNVPSQGLAQLDIRLQARAALTVTVLDPDGSPLPRVWLNAQPAEPRPSRDRRLYRFGKSAMTNLSGQAVLQPLELGSYFISANAANLKPVNEIVEITSVDEAEMELRFRDKADEALYRIAGRVIDDSGLPLARAEVKLSGQPRERRGVVVRSAQSAGDGSFELEAPPGEYQLTGRFEGYASTTSEPFEVADAAVTDLTLELSAGATVVGRVTGLEPEDLSRVAIVARGPYSENEGFEVFGRQYGSINFDGELRIAGLQTGDWQIRAELLNPTRAASERITIERGTSEVRVELRFEAGYQLTGSLLRQGAPVTGGTILLRCRGEFRGQTFTDDAGRFVVEHVPKGACTITGRDPARVQRAEQDFEMTADTDIVLELRSEDG